MPGPDTHPARSNVAAWMGSRADAWLAGWGINLADLGGLGGLALRASVVVSTSVTLHVLGVLRGLGLEAEIILAPAFALALAVDLSFSMALAGMVLAILSFVTSLFAALLNDLFGPFAARKWQTYVVSLLKTLFFCLLVSGFYLGWKGVWSFWRTLIDGLMPVILGGVTLAGLLLLSRLPLLRRWIDSLRRPGRSGRLTAPGAVSLACATLFAPVLVVASISGGEKARHMLTHNPPVVIQGAAGQVTERLLLRSAGMIVTCRPHGPITYHYEHAVSSVSPPEASGTRMAPCRAASAED